MARLIVKSPYYKCGGNTSLSGYLRYIATRERVELLPDDRPPTRKQEQLINKLTKDFPDSKTLYEYEDYAAKPTKCNASAQYLLGKLYLTGKEVPRDEEQAVQWLTRSAEQGNKYARYLLDHREEQRPPDVMLAVTRLLYHMSRVFQDNSLPKSRPGGIQIDRKRLKKLREKKIALGHKPDDHEEEQSFGSMTMGGW
nr:relaxase MobL [uncultured Flavonifractor sp.]